MRKRKEILKEYDERGLHTLEVLLDIRDLLVKEAKQSRKRKKEEI